MWIKSLGIAFFLSLLAIGSALAGSPSSPGIGPLNVSITGGNAGGDLGGTYPNPTVLQFNGTPLGTMATQAAAAVAITGGTITGVTATGSLTVASGCGTTGSATGNSQTGSFTAGQTSCIPVMTLPTAAHGWFCSMNDITHPADAFTQTAKSTTSCTMSATVTSADLIVFNAVPY